LKNDWPVKWLTASAFARQPPPWVEERLAGEVAHSECFCAAAAAAAEHVEPMQDSRIETDFRQHLVSVVTLRALQRSLL
jgi:CO/xanthine dehydrogenase FAD-binding subunit